MIIGLTGTHGAGKGKIAEHLRQRGFRVLRFSDVFRSVCDERGISQTREHLIAVSGELVHRYGKDYAAQKLLAGIEGPAVVDGFRRVAEVTLFRKRKDFFLIGVDANQRLRYERIQSRKDTTDALSFEEFARLEEKEMTNADDNMDITSCLELADALVHNDGTIEELLARVDALLHTFSSSLRPRI